MFQEWLATSPIASWLRTFLAIILTMFIADGANIFAVDSADLKLWVAAAFSASLPAVVRWLNPVDYAFGHGAIPDDRFDVFPDEDQEPTK
jgi:hypothetical protein